MQLQQLTATDEAIVAAQLGRSPRGIAGVAWRCRYGKPGVIATMPRLSDGSPFPTTYYLTCPLAVTACSQLESKGVMAELSQRLASDADFARRYRQAHQEYLSDRNSLEQVPQIAQMSAGGMPDRVKCLHALLAHALASPGINPVGVEVFERIGHIWESPSCEEHDVCASKQQHEED
ncbi:MAG: DUF501 domain-containing protein [Propionibacteriaceae bacterium]|nr:DUF501 domain-containing protein [Propionibacteriaceae bacterium]